MLLLQLGDRQEWVSADRLKPHVGDFLVKFRQTLSPPPILFGISTVILSQAKSKLTRSAGGGLLAPHLGVLVPALLEIHRWRQSCKKAAGRSGRAAEVSPSPSSWDWGGGGICSGNAAAVTLIREMYRKCANEFCANKSVKSQLSKCQVV